MWACVASRPAAAEERVVAVVDFRNPSLRVDFRRKFEETLAESLKGSGISARVRFENVDLTRDTFEPEIARLETARPSVYYATTSDIAREVRRINASVPIVFSGIVDPRAVGLLKSIDHPENNMTGFVSYEDVDDKRLELLADLAPRIKRIGIVFEKGTIAHENFPRRLAFARSRGLEVIPLVFTEEADPAPIQKMIAAGHLDALDAPTSLFVRRNYKSLIAYARAAGIPAAFRGSGFVEDGGLLSYEPREFDYPVKAAQLVARILQGARPVDIAIEFPSEFTLAINLSAIAALPYPVNKGVLYRANKLFP